MAFARLQKVLLVSLLLATGPWSGVSQETTTSHGTPAPVSVGPQPEPMTSTIASSTTTNTAVVPAAAKADKDNEVHAPITYQPGQRARFRPSFGLPVKVPKPSDVLFYPSKAKRYDSPHPEPPHYHSPHPHAKPFTVEPSYRYFHHHSHHRQHHEELDPLFRNHPLGHIPYFRDLYEVGLVPHFLLPHTHHHPPYHGRPHHSHHHHPHPHRHHHHHQPHHNHYHGGKPRYYPSSHSYQTLPHYDLIKFGGKNNYEDKYNSGYSIQDITFTTTEKGKEEVKEKTIMVDTKDTKIAPEESKKAPEVEKTKSR